MRARSGRASRRLALAVLVAAAALSCTALGAAGKFTPLASAAPPRLELRDVQGRVHRLEDYRGKVVLINFWATWCEPCRDEMPSIQTLKERMDRRAQGDLVVLAVNYAEREARVAEFVRQHRLAFPVLLDPFSEAWRAWKPGLLPASYLVGRDGRLRYRVLGELDWSDAKAEAVVTGLMREAAPH